MRINPPKSCYGTIPYRIRSLFHRTGAKSDIPEHEMKMILGVVEQGSGTIRSVVTPSGGLCPAGPRDSLCCTRSWTRSAPWTATADFGAPPLPLLLLFSRRQRRRPSWRRRRLPSSRGWVTACCPSSCSSTRCCRSSTTAWSSR